MQRYVMNEALGGGLFTADEYRAVERFYAGHAQWGSTPLVSMPALAERVGLGELLVKDESQRWGVRAFKITGVAFAVAQLLDARTRTERDVVLACATAGNHGRAVARVARENGLRAEVYVPMDAPAAQVEAICAEGATVTSCDEQYDAVVERLVRDAETEGWQIVSDTAWEGYEEIPRWIMAGYTRLMAEAERQWGAARPDVVIAQAGVGGLACAVGSWVDAHFGRARPVVICAEPAGAACLLASARAGRRVMVDGHLETMMNGLRCGVPSPLAWPPISRTFDAFVAVTDEEAATAMRAAAPMVEAGPSGACGLAAAMAIFASEEFEEVRRLCGKRPRVMVINTEGATNPPLYAEIVGATE